ncbi:hypothetical protein [Thiofilum flexile]|uniref:hypothetical protein n=1 Tax=Thiofilum flexile TaxID=125627 RepID=UPI000362D97C|nr:hypothetical protein [Thiofilum flexile]
MNTPTPTPANFDQRLQRVKDEIEKRIAQKHPENPYAMRARLWVNWLTKNVQDEIQGEVHHA